MAYEPDNFPPDRAWFLIGAMVIFAAQVAVYLCLLIQCLIDRRVP